MLKVAGESLLKSRSGQRVNERDDDPCLQVSKDKCFSISPELGVKVVSRDSVPVYHVSVSKTCLMDAQPALTVPTFAKGERDQEQTSNFSFPWNILCLRNEKVLLIHPPSWIIRFKKEKNPFVPFLQSMHFNI